MLAATFKVRSYRVLLISMIIFVTYSIFMLRKKSQLIIGLLKRLISEPIGTVVSFYKQFWLVKSRIAPRANIV